MNDKFEDLIGEHSHIDNTLVIPLPKGSSKFKTTSMIELNSKNTFFTDIEKVQQAMVRHSGSTALHQQVFIANFKVTKVCELLGFAEILISFQGDLHSLCDLT